MTWSVLFFARFVGCDRSFTKDDISGFCKWRILGEIMLHFAASVTDYVREENQQI